MKPNFITILTDDHGYGDLGCMGADDLKTPHLDRLAAGGARFSDWYSNSPVCSPSRAALLTGRHPARTGITDVLGGHRSEPGLSPEIPTLATALKPLGYRTGLVGKWHLGVAEGFRPSDHGFDDWFGLLSGTIDYFSHIDYNLWPWDPTYYPVHDLWENDTEVWRNGRYMTELISENAVEFLRRGEGSDTPFFLHVAYNAPHSPMHAPAEYIDRFPELTPARRISSRTPASSSCQTTGLPDTRRTGSTAIWSRTTGLLPGLCGAGRPACSRAGCVLPQSSTGQRWCPRAR